MDGKLQLSRTPWIRRELRPAVWAIFVGFILATSLYLVVYNQEWDELERNFTNKSLERFEAIQSQFVRHLNGLDLTRRFFLSSVEVEPSEFAEYTQPLFEQLKFDSLQWAPRIASGQIQNYIEKSHKILPKNFQIPSPPAPVDFIMPAILVEPANHAAVYQGMDYWKLPEVRAAFADPSRTNLHLISARPADFSFTTSPPTFLAFAEMDVPNRPGELILATLDVDVLVDSALRPLRPGGVDIWLEEEGPRGLRNRFYYHSSRTHDGRTMPSRWKQKLVYERSFVVGGKKLEVRFGPAPALLDRHSFYNSKLAFVVVLLVSGMLAIYLAFNAYRTAQVEALVKKRTDELQKSEEVRLGLERSLLQVQKMEAVGTLAGGIAHDFNNLLGSIIGYSQLAMDEVGFDHPARKDLQRVLSTGLKGRELVKKILTFSREHVSSKSPVDMQSVIQEVLVMARSSLPASISIDVYSTLKQERALADFTQMEQVLFNLIANASQAFKSSTGKIYIRLDSVWFHESDQPQFPEVRPGNFIKLTVSDEGSGMDAPTMARIFEPFFTTKPVGAGTGLGLSVVHGIVRGHNGAIRVMSQLNVGTTFEVYIPTAVGQDSPPTEKGVWK